MAKAKKRESGIATAERPGGVGSPEFSEAAPESSAPQSVGDTTAAAPDRDRIAMRAYELYLARGGGEGMELEDWLRAEQELNSRRDRQTGE